MDLDRFDYSLPKDRIAQRPLAKRDSSRLLVVDREKKNWSDKIFSDILECIPAGDVLVLNDTKVFPARIIGKKKKTEGKVDLLLLNPYRKASGTVFDEWMPAAEAEALGEKKIWRCLVQPALKEGQEICFDGGPEEALFIKRDSDGIPLIEFTHTGDVRNLAERIGTMPLPPYIKREAEGIDKTAYQTVFAKNEGAVAAPTAGFHFTTELLNDLRAKGVDILAVTLHVGYGTFKPVEDLENHRMHAENFILSPAVADRLNKAKADHKKIWAVGTTTLRVLETCTRQGTILAGQGETDLFIKEPFTFEAVDHLITNFHLPKTTLLLLVSAFMGESLRKTAYEHAIRKQYRFYSYGDAMLIL